MRQVPGITTSSDDIVVDDIKYRQPFLGLFGEERWIIVWRSVSNPDTRGETVLRAEARSGSATLGGEPFTFAVRWREDRRRAVRLFDEEDYAAPAPALRLAEAPVRSGPALRRQA